MKKALIIIDFVNDFVADSGALTCGRPAQEIDDNIARIVKSFSESGDYVVAASDSHEPDDDCNPEHKLFPPHCIRGSSGGELYGNTLKAVENVKPRQLLRVEKLRYSAFAGTDLDLKLRERGVTGIYLTGVCSDICVLHTAIDAYNLGYRVHVYENAVASFNSEGHAFAINHFKNVLGAEMQISTD